jgi:hypothetical protein
MNSILFRGDLNPAPTDVPNPLCFCVPVLVDMSNLLVGEGSPRDIGIGLERSNLMPAWSIWEQMWKQFGNNKHFDGLLSAVLDVPMLS